MNPLLILAVGVAIVLGLILVLRINAFIALVCAAIVVSILAPGATGEKMTRVAAAFGETAGAIGIVIALAAVVGKCMMDSGAADRIVRALLSMLGEKRAAAALTTSGFVLSIPVFFDTAFYLLVPLARSTYRRTNRHYLKFLMAIAAGGVVTHTLVPPTPGPLFVANQLGVDVGMMMLMGVVIGIPAAAVGLLYGRWLDRRMPIEMRPIGGGTEEPEPLAAGKLPGLMISLAPILLPILLITSNSFIKVAGYTALAKEPSILTDTPAARFVHDGRLGVATTTADGKPRFSALTDGEITEALFAAADNDMVIARVFEWSNIFGNPNFALLLSAAIAVLTFHVQLRPGKKKMAATIESALMSGGVIILITAAGGAFGAMLKAAKIGEAISQLFGDALVSGVPLLLFAFFMASLIKFAQGSSTSAMIVASGMIAAMVTPESFGFHPVYLATAIGSGSIVGSWMNDSGFWIFSKMGGLTEVESLKSWTPLLALIGVTSMIVTVVLAIVLPLTSVAAQ